MSARKTTSLNFSWILDHALAGSAAPMVTDDLAYLKGEGANAIMRLADPDTDDYVLESSDVQQANLVDKQIPVPDFHAPSPGQIDEALKFIDDQLKAGNAVVVSCGAGCGRTGTIIACYLITQGYTAGKALELLVSKRPCSKEIIERTPEQMEAILNFERRFRSRRPAKIEA